MVHVLTCPNGHRWELSLDGLGTEPAAPVACPVCGQLCPVVPISSQPEDTVLHIYSAGGATMPAQAAHAAKLPRVPGYEVISQLGQGGMGRVFKARHLQLERLVALKMIAAEHASSQHLARFRVEAQALARLQHPHIVQIYEINECDGTPYFALELLEGGSLDRKLAGTPQPPRGAARLVETVARAVHVAHENGVIHRDLKPGNILLTRGGEPKITDFGLAKRLEEQNSQTQTGAILGTPVYMAPEQAGAGAQPVGPPADVYALGVILYEMLTGRPPFQGLTALETLDMIRSAEPVSPRRLQPGVPGDLETICMKCLEKEPARRYAGALELADDLDRFLLGKPITARRAGPSERLWKWLKRHPAPAALIAVIVLAVVTVVSLSVWSNAQLRRAALRAQERSDLARAVVDDMYTKVAEELLLDEPDKDLLRQEFLRKALQLYQDFAEERREDPKIRRETAQAFFRLGQIHRVLNEREEARAAFGRAILLQEELTEQFPRELQYRQDLADSHNWRGELFRESGGGLEEAEDDYRRALEIQADLVAESAEPAYRKELARSHYNLAVVQMDTARADEAASNLERAVELLEPLCARFPDVHDYRHELARCHINRGVLEDERKEPVKAGAEYQRAIRLLQELKTETPTRALYRIDLAVAHQNLGNLYWQEGESSLALHELGRAAALLERLVSDFPARPAYKKKLANTYNSRASVRASTRAWKEAEHDWTQARDLLQELVREHSETADHEKLLGITIGNLGWLRSERARTTGILMTVVREPVSVPVLALCLIQEWTQARRHFEKSIEHLRHTLPANPKNPETLQALRNQYQNLAEALVQLGDHAAAVDAATALPAVLEGARDYYFAACFLARCIPLAEKDVAIDLLERQTRARRYSERALAMLQNAIGKGNPVERLSNESDIFRPVMDRSRLKRLLSELKPSP